MRYHLEFDPLVRAQTFRKAFTIKSFAESVGAHGLRSVHEAVASCLASEACTPRATPARQGYRAESNVASVISCRVPSRSVTITHYRRGDGIHRDRGDASQWHEATTLFQQVTNCVVVSFCASVCFE